MRSGVRVTVVPSAARGQTGSRRFKNRPSPNDARWMKRLIVGIASPSCSPIAPTRDPRPERRRGASDITGGDPDRGRREDRVGRLCPSGVRLLGPVGGHRSLVHRGRRRQLRQRRSRDRRGLHAIPIFTEMLGAPTPWIKIDPATVPGMADQLGSLAGGQADPTGTLTMLYGLIDVEEVGTERVDGASATHYRATFDLTKAPSRYPTRTARRCNKRPTGSRDPRCNGGWRRIVRDDHDALARGRCGGRPTAPGRPGHRHPRPDAIDDLGSAARSTTG